MAIVLDGSDVAYAPTQSYNDDVLITIVFELWRPTSHGDAQFDRIFELGGYQRGDNTTASGTHSGGIGIEVAASTGQINCNVWNSSGTTTFGATAITAETWTLIGVTSSFTSGVTEFWVAGSSQGTSSSRTRETDADRFTLGGLNDTADGTPSNMTNCKIRNLGMYEGVLWSSTDFSSYSVGTSTPADFNSANLVGGGYWPLDTDAAHSNGGDTLTLVGATFDGVASGPGISVPLFIPRQNTLLRM